MLFTCFVSAETSILSSVPPRSSSSIKSILRRHFLKKRSTTVQLDDNQTNSKSQHKKKLKSVHKMKSKTNTNYDMTILHHDELDNTQLATVRRYKKQIPLWANEDQLQLAIINQVYFQNINPEDIFGTICIEHVFDIIDSLKIHNKQGTSTMI